MKKDMTEGREWSSILLFSLPIMGANLLQVLYNLADSVIVGNLISATALGAVGLTSSMTWLLTAICTSIGAGVNIAVAQYSVPKRDGYTGIHLRLLSDCRDRKYIFNCRLLSGSPSSYFRLFAGTGRNAFRTVWHTF